MRNDPEPIRFAIPGGLLAPRGPPTAPKPSEESKGPSWPCIAAAVWPPPSPPPKEANVTQPYPMMEPEEQFDGRSEIDRQLLELAQSKTAENRALTERIATLEAKLAETVATREENERLKREANQSATVIADLRSLQREDKSEIVNLENRLEALEETTTQHLAELAMLISRVSKGERTQREQVEIFRELNRDLEYEMANGKRDLPF